MKVMCIDATPNLLPRCLKEGDIYTVIGEPETPGGYILSEVRHPHEPAYGFKKTRFVPLSDIDETEMIRENILTETIC